MIARAKPSRHRRLSRPPLVARATQKASHCTHLAIVVVVGLIGAIDWTQKSPLVDSDDARTSRPAVAAAVISVDSPVTRPSSPVRHHAHSNRAPLRKTGCLTTSQPGRRPADAHTSVVRQRAARLEWPTFTAAASSSQPCASNSKHMLCKPTNVIIEQVDGHVQLIS